METAVCVVTIRDAHGKLVGAECTGCMWTIKGKSKVIYEQMQNHLCKKEKEHLKAERRT